MENTNVPVEKEESTTNAEPIVEEKSKTNGEQAVTADMSSKTTEDVEEKEDEIVPTTINEQQQEDKEVTKSTDEQENLTDTNTISSSINVSPGRANIPLKEVNESENKEETAGVINDNTENSISKKRELEQEDEPTEDITNDNDERTGDQTKKIKITETIDTPTIETKEPENNIIVNGNTAVEV